VSLVTALIVAALVAAVILLLESHDRVVPGIALFVSGLELLIRLQIVRLGAVGIHWGVGGGITLAALGAVAWVRTSSKTGATAATVLLMTGLMQVWLLR